MLTNRVLALVVVVVAALGNVCEAATYQYSPRQCDASDPTCGPTTVTTDDLKTTNTNNNNNNNNNKKTVTFELKPKKPVIKAEDVTEALVNEWFGSWYNASSSKRRVKDAFKKEVPYEINGFLAPAKAELLYNELYTLAKNDQYKLYEGNHHTFQFRHHNLFEAYDSVFRQNYAMTQLHEIFNSKIVRSWFESVSAIALCDKTVSGVSQYQPGDYSMIHSDWAAGQHNTHRRVTFVMHMSKNWPQENGGTLVYMNPTQFIHPSFNNMVLFKTTQQSYHIVTPVWAHTPSHLQRLAFSGWWVSYSNK